MDLIKRTAITTTACAALAGAFIAGMAINQDGAPIVGGPTSDPGTIQQGTAVRLVNADLTNGSDCETLRSWYVDRAASMVTPWGWGYGGEVMYDAARGAESSETDSAPAEAPADGQTSSETGTNVQEIGVDEPDLVKTNGEILVRVQDLDKITIFDVTGTEPTELGSIDLDKISNVELLLVGTRVVAIGVDTSANYADDGTLKEPAPYNGYSTIPYPGTRVTVIDIADPATPTVVNTAVYESTLVAARQNGDAVRLILSATLPDLEFVEPGFLRSEEAALRRNREVVARSTLEDWLPAVRFDDGVAQTISDCAEVQLPAKDAGLGTMTIVGFDPAAPTHFESTAVATQSTITYLSVERLYLAAGSWFGGGCCAVGGDVVVSSDEVQEGTTQLYGFELDGLTTTYAASGEVEGSIADRWSMDEHQGVLRVAVGQSSQTGNFNSVITLAQQGSDLVEAGRLDRLGVNEQIQSVRWFDTMAVVVTFRQTDPLYAIDLTTDQPRLLGELKIPGFSSYLHPIGDNLIMGIGTDADPNTGVTNGAKASLFDITDVTAPRELSTVIYGKTSMAAASWDPRQFTWLPDRDTALTVITKGYDYPSGKVSVLGVKGKQLTNRMVPVEYGDDVYSVRLVPLPSGKVVLMTDQSVTFFEV